MRGNNAAQLLILSNAIKSFVQVLDMNNQNVRASLINCLCPIKRLMIMTFSVDCVMGEWKEWNTCTKSCGAGTKSRIRGIMVEPAFEGNKCGSTIDTVDCNINPCPGSVFSFSCINVMYQLEIKKLSSSLKLLLL